MEVFAGVPVGRDIGAETQRHHCGNNLRRRIKAGGRDFARNAGFVETLEPDAERAVVGGHRRSAKAVGDFFLEEERH